MIESIFFSFSFSRSFLLMAFIKRRHTYLGNLFKDNGGRKMSLQGTTRRNTKASSQNPKMDNYNANYVSFSEARLCRAPRYVECHAVNWSLL